MTREQIIERAVRLGLGVRTYAPGDGALRYQFTFAHLTSNVMTGAKEADAFLDGVAWSRHVEESTG